MNQRGIGMTSQRTRERLVARLREQGIRNEAVLDAMRHVPRHLFVDEALASRAYEDTALPIGYGQTISQPYIVARMTETLLEAGRPRKVLEIGTGSGYQTAVLAGLADIIYTVERIEPLYKLSRKRLRELRLHQVHFKLDDGSLGWAEHGPYDRVIVTAGATEVPQALVEQLAAGGCMLIPAGEAAQELLLISRTAEGATETRRLELVNFVPLVTGKARTDGSR